MVFDAGRRSGRDHLRYVTFFSLTSIAAEDEDGRTDGKLLLLTPIDPLFLLLPLLIALSPIDPFSTTAAASEPEGRFEPFETIFDRATTAWSSSASDPGSNYTIEPKDIETFVGLGFIRSTVSRLCDSLSTSTDSSSTEGEMYRLSKSKTITALSEKVHRIVKATEEAEKSAKAGSGQKGDGATEEEEGGGGGEGPTPLLARLLGREEGVNDVGGVSEGVMKGAAPLPSGILASFLT